MIRPELDQYSITKMFVKSALVALLVVGLTVVAFEEDNNFTCYDCLTDIDVKHCEKIDKDTEIMPCPTKECYTAVATYKTDNTKSLIRGCLSPLKTCEKLGESWKDVGKDFKCETCKINKCNTAELRMFGSTFVSDYTFQTSLMEEEDVNFSCYQCITDKDGKHCEKVDEDTEVTLCATKKCYTMVATSIKNDTTSLVRGCLPSPLTCEIIKEAWKDGKDFKCKTCNDNKCNTAELMTEDDEEFSCYDCTTDVDGKNCKKVDDNTKVTPCPTKECYTAVATYKKDNKKSLERNCFSQSMTCEKLDEEWENVQSMKVFECKPCRKNKCNTAELMTDEDKDEHKDTNNSASSIATSLVVTAIAVVLVSY